MSGQNVSMKKMIAFMGSILSFCIGAGFATGQEVLQYFTSFGLAQGIGAVVLTAAGYLFMCIAFMYAGNTAGLKDSNEIFKFYCGNALGKIYEIYSVVLLFLIYIVMISGAGGVFSDYYGLPQIYGNIVMTAISCIAVLVGFRRLVNILGALGPIIVIGCIAVALLAIVSNPGGLSTATEFVEQADMLKSADTWWLSGILYPAFMCVMLATFVSEMGMTASNKKEAVIGGTMGAIAFALGVLLVFLAELANVEQVYNSQIPMLILARNLVPIIASIFSIIMLGGIFTTAAPCLWSACVKFGHDGSRRFRITAVILAIAALFGVMFLPFNAMVNIVYPPAGWAGIVLMVIMAVKHLKGKKTETKAE